MKTSVTLDRPEAPEPPDRPRIQLSATQVIASALAATTATVAASFLGVAGTVIGAALASVLTVTGNAVYSHSLQRTGIACDRVPPSAACRGRATAPAPPAEHARRHPSPAGWTASPPPASACSPACLLVVTTVELVAGRPLSDVVRGQSGSGTSLLGDPPHGRAGPTPAPAVTVTMTPNVVTTTPTATVTGAPGDARRSRPTPDRPPRRRPRRRRATPTDSPRRRPARAVGRLNPVVPRTLRRHVRHHRLRRSAPVPGHRRGRTASARVPRLRLGRRRARQPGRPAAGRQEGRPDREPGEGTGHPSARRHDRDRPHPLGHPRRARTTATPTRTSTRPAGSR